MQAAVSANTRIVINCAAYTDVDGAEADEAEATRVNGHGAGNLAARCAETGAVLVHFSTDYVFDGSGTRPYPTDHPLAPLGAYGRSKAAGEAAIRASGCEHLIIRTSWLYAPWGKNFVRTMVELGRKHESLRVVNDQRGRPSSCSYLAERTLALLDHGARGTFHVTDGGECTWFEFATEIMVQTGSKCRVEPCTTDEFPRPAPRPAYSVLDLSATESLLGPSSAWQDNLRRTTISPSAE